MGWSGGWSWAGGLVRFRAWGLHRGGPAGILPFGLLQDCPLESPICYSKGIAFGVSYYTRIPLGVGYFVVAVVVVVVFGSVSCHFKNELDVFVFMWLGWFHVG